MLLNRFAKFLAAATFALIVAGGLVTSTDSGLSVPDWPLSYGSLTPPMIGGIRFEHTHRLIAGSVGFLTLAFMIFVFMKEKRRWVRRLALAAFLAVILQAVLGGLTVIYLLPPALSVMHACLAQTFFCLVSVLALATGKEWEAFAGSLAENRSLKRLLVTTTLFVYLQLVAGAVIRHVPASGVQIHLFLAFLIVIHALFVVLKIASNGELAKKFLGHATVVGALVLVQIFLGLGSFIVTRALKEGEVSFALKTLLTTTHQASGALILAGFLLLTLRVFRLLRNEPRVKTNRLSVPKKISVQPYLELTKPRLTLTAVLTTFLGFIMGGGHAGAQALWHTLAGALLIGAGANALNQFLEKDVDSRMKRTEGRPLPSGRLPDQHALWFGALASCAGMLELLFFVNTLAALLGAATLTGYVLVYTPLKRVTPSNTLVGAVVGALPSLIGWAAVQNRLGFTAWSLFFILFVWQLPHFLAISWVYREDYRKSGLRMLAANDSEGGLTAWRIAWNCLILFLASLLPALFGLAGPVYSVIAAGAGVAFTGFALMLVHKKMAPAKKFVSASIAYLLVLIVFMIADKV